MNNSILLGGRPLRLAFSHMLAWVTLHNVYWRKCKYCVTGTRGSLKFELFRSKDFVFLLPCLSGLWIPLGWANTEAMDDDCSNFLVFVCRDFRELFVKSDGTLLKEGDLYVNKKLGATLRMIADDPLTFYNGSLAENITQDIRDFGLQLNSVHKIILLMICITNQSVTFVRIWIIWNYIHWQTSAHAAAGFMFIWLSRSLIVLVLYNWFSGHSVKTKWESYQAE